MTEKELDGLLDQIEQLTTDEQLNAVYASLKVARRRVSDAKADEARRSLSKGDDVRLTAPLSPQYLRGLSGTIAERPTGKHVKVKLDRPASAGKYARLDGTIQAPITCVEKI
jgi:hypothetical protein